MMDARKLHVLDVRPVNPGRGESKYIELPVVLSYLTEEPVIGIRLTPARCIELIEQLARAVRVTT